MLIISDTSPIINLAVIGQLIPSVCPFMDRLRAEANFFIDRQLYDYIKNIANE